MRTFPRRTSALGLRTLAAPVAVVLLLASQVSCGSSDPESTNAKESSSSASTVDADFVARADAVCKPYAAYSSKTYLKLKFNRYAPDPDLLPQVAAHLEENLAYKDLASDLESLGDPESGGDAWATVMSDLQTTAQDVNSEIAAAQDAATGRFTELSDQLVQDTTRLRAHLGAAGLAASSCLQAEGDPIQLPPTGH